MLVMVDNWARRYNVDEPNQVECEDARDSDDNGYEPDYQCGCSICREMPGMVLERKRVKYSDFDINNGDIGTFKTLLKVATPRGMFWVRLDKVEKV